MIKNMTLGQYLPGTTLLHKSDPRTKIILTFLFMTFFIIINKYYQFAASILFTVIILIGTKVPVKYVIKSIKPILFIVLITGVVNLVTTKGSTALDLRLFKITYEGLDITIKMALRLTLIMVNASLMTLTTTPITITDGFERLLGGLKRFKIPVHEIAMMMSIALRFIPTLIEETDKLMKAQASRGAEFDQGNIINRARSYIPLLVPLLVGAFRRAEDLAMAMEARCYKGGEGRTRLRQLKFTNVDIHVTIIFAFFILANIILTISLK
ncbi:MAG: energy-coupling factor transporter transmembrane component T [Bacillota bacterium]|nr:energy-coupling factor transporter transmembrane component T [Bacillota bacterium]